MNKKLKIGLLLFISTVTYFTKVKSNDEIEWTTENACISRELFDYIRNVLPEGSTMLELGSGWASGQLSKFYNVYSVEHSEKWMDKYETNYLYVPAKGSWYNPEILKTKLPQDYDFLLVDGPPGYWGTRRDGFYTYLHLFKTDLIIIIDDVNRKGEYNLMVRVARKLGKPFEIYSDSFGKKFGVIDNRY